MRRETVDIESSLERHPYGMVAGALGLGFVLGGGLFTRLTARIAGAGMRIGLIAALPLLKEELVRVAQRALDEPKLNIKKKGHSQ